MNLLPLLGKPINDPAITTFLSDHKYKSPKKLTISNKAGDRSFWIEHKNGIDLLFSIDIHANYTPPQEKKGVFYPLLTYINYRKSAKLTYPFDISFGSSYEELVKKLGNPTQKSSEVAAIWFEDGKESFYDWELPLEKDAVLFVRYNTENAAVFSIVIELQQHQEAFHLYDPLMYETFEKFEQTTAPSVLHFVRWAIENHLVVETDTNRALLNDIRTGKQDVMEYIRSLNRGYVALEDFSTHRVFIRQYLNRLMENDVYYYSDFVHLFIKNKKLLDNYLGEDAQQFLKTFHWDEAAYQQVKTVISKRLAAFKQP